MARFLVVLIFVMFAACAVAEVTPTLRPVAPRRPRVDGNTEAVSAEDIRTVQALMAAQARDRHRSRVPIARVHVIDHATMRVHYWIPGSDTWTYARRVKGRWRIDYADTERVIVTGNERHSGW